MTIPNWELEPVPPGAGPTDPVSAGSADGMGEDPNCLDRVDHVESPGRRRFGNAADGIERILVWSDCSRSLDPDSEALTQTAVGASHRPEQADGPASIFLVHLGQGFLDVLWSHAIEGNAWSQEPYGGSCCTEPIFQISVCGTSSDFSRICTFNPIRMTKIHNAIDTSDQCSQRRHAHVL